MNCFHVNISCICHPRFARLRAILIFVMGWYLFELTTMNLVLNALIEYKFCVFFSYFLIINDSIKSQRRSFFLNCDLWGSNSGPLRLWNLSAAIFAFFIHGLALLLDNLIILKNCFIMKVTTITESAREKFCWSKFSYYETLNCFKLFHKPN